MEKKNEFYLFYTAGEESSETCKYCKTLDELKHAVFIMMLMPRPIPFDTTSYNAYVIYGDSKINIEYVHDIFGYDVPVIIVKNADGEDVIPINDITEDDIERVFHDQYYIKDKYIVSINVF